MTTIEWTQETWNPVTGCNKISPGCAHCYAADIAKRFWGERKFTDVQFHPERLEQPLKWRKPRTVFVNSMSDLFHESVTDEQLDQVFAVMALTPQHTYQVLTKRPERMQQYCDRLDLRRLIKAADLPMPSGSYQIKLPLPNVWLGVTVENQKAADTRIPLLLRTPAAIRFLSCEPLLEAIDLAKWLRPVVVMHSESSGFLNGDAIVGTSPDSQINWTIVGGESGSKARPCNVEWIRSVVQQCTTAQVPVFVKQLGSRPAGLEARGTGKHNDLEIFPADLQLRQMPA
ncbi:DUF5131 family protein [Pantanalinema sp. GBBB05]|uniref:DUF5131 family protein n=1 Tax=Pantanalinema sp. GBBB05 TaxID=2604139 RepID=UPI001D5151F7|nr:phage Gp37/Gp68 family protein [Pantanalinema sp. GBBB05]